MLSAASVSFRYPGSSSAVLENVSLDIAPGEFVALAGRSGRGKTTLARLLAGYETPTAGTITVDGKPVRSIRGFYPVQLVFQHPEKAINPRWKMEKTLLENGRLDGRMVETLGIEPEWLGRYPNELSGGELQRFCVARALTAETRYLIADEMTTMLDAITQAQIWQAVGEWAKKNGAGVLVVSHDAALVARLCGRTVALA
jgi:peptide/nickel transport system ATP-binding protein